MITGDDLRKAAQAIDAAVAEEQKAAETSPMMRRFRSRFQSKSRISRASGGTIAKGRIKMPMKPAAAKSPTTTKVKK